MVSTPRVPARNASDAAPTEQWVRRAPSAPSPPHQRSAPDPAPREILTRSPWDIYEACASISYGRAMVLARHRENKADLVHIQMQAVERSTIELCVRTIDRLAHGCIPRLRDVFHYAERYLLVWEPFEFTLFEAQAIMRHIPETEVAQILWPVCAASHIRDDRG